MKKDSNITCNALINTINGKYLIPEWIKVHPDSTLDNIIHLNEEE